MMLYNKKAVGLSYRKCIPLLFTRTGSAWMQIIRVKDTDKPIMRPIYYHNLLICYNNGKYKRDMDVDADEFKNDIFVRSKDQITFFMCNLNDWIYLNPSILKEYKGCEDITRDFTELKWIEDSGGYPTYVRLLSRIRYFIKHQQKFSIGKRFDYYTRYDEEFFQ